jgi:1A family penicillin-binding protein
MKKIIKFIKKRWWIFPSLIFLAGIGIFTYFLSSLPSPKQLTNQPAPASTEIYDRNGELLYEIYGDQDRVPIKLNDLPDHAIDAALAIEDQNFYKHHGFDFRGISRAFINTVFKRDLQGGSTITQQLVKNALLSPERTLSRKFKEAILTLLTEVMYSKNQILEMYFNQIPYGGTAYGIESAARTFFDKSATELDLAESAVLAGLPAAPTRYSPFIHPDHARGRQKTVLKQMRNANMITQEEYDQAKEKEIKFASPGSTIKAPHFVFYVKEQLVEKYGQQMVERGGLKVKTSLDLSLQETAQGIVKEEIRQLERAKVSNGAALVNNPKTGEILAMVGSKDYFADDIDGQFNVTTALRQPGSSIKPLNYVTGLDTQKVTPATVFADVPTCFTGGPKSYCPRNYDGMFHGPVQVRFALGNSFNIPAVRMLKHNGLKTFIASASAAGLDSLGKRDPADFGLSLTLGGGEVKMTEMATAFSTLANLGMRKDLSAILEVKDRSGKVLEEFSPPSGKRVFSMEASYLVSHILLDNNARAAAFGTGSWLVIDDHPEVAVKTGTTNDKRDNWTIGYTPSYTVTVWVGNNDNSPMGYVASGVTGASPIWNKIMTHVLEDKKEEWQTKPANITGASVCNLTGALPPENGSCQSRYEYFIKGTIPSAKPIKQPVLIDKDTGWPVQLGEEKENVEWQEHQIVKDPLGTIFCLDCPPREEPVIVGN